MKCRHGHEHGSIVAASACSKESAPPAPKRCDENAGGCGRSELEGAVLRDGSALCEACKEAIAEVQAEDDEKVAAVRALVVEVQSIQGKGTAAGQKKERAAVAAFLRGYLGHEPSADQVKAVLR